MSDHPETTDSRTIAMSRTAVLQGVRRRRVAYLDITYPDGRKVLHKVTETAVIIGRTEDNTLTFPYSNVSRHHAKVYSAGEEFVVEDTGSTNGTYVNGTRIAKCILRQQDLIQVGDTRMVYSEREELMQ
jgi:pSer/pThr/pTyr-binding forkhead associated (FHA) protein